MPHLAAVGRDEVQVRIGVVVGENGLVVSGVEAENIGLDMLKGVFGESLVGLVGGPDCCAFGKIDDVDDSFLDLTSDGKEKGPVIVRVELVEIGFELCQGLYLSRQTLAFPLRYFGVAEKGSPAFEVGFHCLDLSLIF